MAADWIARHEAEFKESQAVSFAVTLRSDDTLVGAISLMAIAKDHQAEMGYWIGKPFWIKGYCTEAGQAILNYAFTKLTLLRVYAQHLSRNPASGKVMQRLGMRHEGTRRKHVIKWEKHEDVELYGILREEWE